MRRASVVIVGAGVMGASVAYHLAARGWRDVLMVDRSAGPGRGSTGAATGGSSTGSNSGTTGVLGVQTPPVAATAVAGVQNLPSTSTDSTLPLGALGLAMMAVGVALLSRRPVQP